MRFSSLLIATAFAATPVAAQAVDSAFFPSSSGYQSPTGQGSYFGIGYAQGSVNEDAEVVLTEGGTDYVATNLSENETPKGLRINWGYQGEVLGVEASLLDGGEATFTDKNPSPNGDEITGQTPVQGLEVGGFGTIPFDEGRKWQGIVGFGLAYFEGNEQWKWIGKDGSGNDQVVTLEESYENQTPFYRVGLQFRSGSGSFSLDHRVYLRAVGTDEREFTMTGLNLNYHY